MKYLSVCSGIEAATTAWHSLGWQPVAFAEIEKFPSAVLAHHWPDVPNLGDMTKYDEWKLDDTIDLLVGGTPCQSFSVAGLRKGLADPRGNLTLTFLGMVDRFRPKWLVWENVPGVLSDKGNAFGQFLSGLAELGYEYAYRVLDAQHFGVPQRRRRVFVVGCPRGSGVHPAEVLFEPESLCRDLTPSRKARDKVAPGVSCGPPFSRTGNERVECEALVPDKCGTLNHSSGSAVPGNCPQDWNAGMLIPEVANPLTAKMHKGINTTLDEGQTPVPVAFHPTQDPISSTDGTIHAMGTGSKAGCATHAVAIRTANTSANGHGIAEDVAHTIDQVQGQAVASQMAVRRLTPTECERLQGFPDGHTRIPWRGKDADQCPDGPRYKALGNSMAVPVMRWIGERITKTQ